MKKYVIQKQRPDGSIKEFSKYFPNKELARKYARLLNSKSLDNVFRLKRGQK